MFKKILALVFIISITTSYATTTSNCWPACSCNQDSLVCTNFNYFTDLDFTTPANNQMFKSIVIKPKIRQSLTEKNLNLTGLTIAYTGFIEISNVEKFYFNANPLKSLKRERFTTTLRLTDAVFKFMLDENTELNSACTSRLISPTDEHDHSLMSSVNRLELESIDFIEPICPFIFNNVKILNFIVRKPNGQFKFLSPPIDRPDKNVTYFKKKIQISGLGSIVKFLAFENVDFDGIDANVLNNDVFGAIESVTFRNVSAKKIEPSVFQGFKYLGKLEMGINWKDIIDRTELQWMYDLNRHTEIVDFKKLDKFSANKFDMFLDFGNYTFPDEDFCKFYDFPLKKYVVPYISRNTSIVCNCIVAWLLQYARVYPFNNDFGMTSGNYMHCVSDVKLAERCQQLQDKNHCEIHSPMSLRQSDELKKQSNIFSFFSLKSPIAIIVTIVLSLMILVPVIYFVHKKIRNKDNGENLGMRAEYQNAETDDFI